MRTEQIYISRILASELELKKTESILSPEYFESLNCRKVFETALQIYDAGGKVDAMSIWKIAGKDADVLNLVEVASSQTDIERNVSTENLAQAVLRQYQERQYKEVGQLLQFGKMNPSNASDYLAEINALSTQEKKETIGDLVDKSQSELSKRVKAYRSGQEIEGIIKSGFDDIDYATVFQANQMIGIAARPAMGKSSFKRQLAMNMAKKGHPILIFSLEMSKEQIINRMICSEGNLNATRYRQGEFTDNEIKCFADAGKVVRGLPIEIEVLTDLQGVRSSIVNWGAELSDKSGVVFIDYMQQMYDSSKKHGSRDLELGYISKTLLQLTKKFNFCLVPLFQLSRGNVNRGGDKKPQLSDLRDSGNFEQDLDVAMFLHRPEYYGFEVTEEGSSTLGLAEILIRKNRHGPTFDSILRWTPKYTQFHNWLDQPFLKQEPENKIMIPEPSTDNAPF